MKNGTFSGFPFLKCGQNIIPGEWETLAHLFRILLAAKVRIIVTIKSLLDSQIYFKETYNTDNIFTGRSNQSIIEN